MPRYRVAGLPVASAVALPGASPDRTAPESPAAITVTVGSGPAPSPDIARGRDPAIPREAARIVIQVLPGLSFRISDGVRIEIFHAPEVSDADVTLFLLGTAWGILCHQRGLLPLHCSAVDCAGGLFAFTGDSGMGKSTLAAGLALRGLSHLTDDVMVVDLAPGPPRLSPMPKGLKLCDDAAAHLRVDRGHPVSVLIPDKSYVSLPTDAPAKDAPPPARALYVLAWHKDAALAPAITPLTGMEAWTELYRAVYRVELLPAIAPHAAVARRVAALARHLPVYRFTRHRALARFDSGLDVIEAHMRGLVDAGEGVAA